MKYDILFSVESSDLTIAKNRTNPIETVCIPAVVGCCSLSSQWRADSQARWPTPANTKLEPYTPQHPLLNINPPTPMCPRQC